MNQLPVFVGMNETNIFSNIKYPLPKKINNNFYTLPKKINKNIIFFENKIDSFKPIKTPSFHLTNQ